MTDKFRHQGTKKFTWIPKVSAIVALLLAQTAFHGHAVAGPTSAPAARDGSAWESWILILIEMMIRRLSCPSLQLPPDFPMAMMVTAECFYAHGLAPMTLSERLEFLALLDEVDAALNEAPAGSPEDILKKFQQAVEDMRQAAQAVP